MQHLTPQQKQDVKDEADAEARYAKVPEVKAPEVKAPEVKTGGVGKNVTTLRDQEIEKAQKSNLLSVMDVKRRIDSANLAADDAAKEETESSATKTFWERFKIYMDRP